MLEYQERSRKKTENKNKSPIEAPMQKKSIGLPEGLQNGIEQLSGYSMNDVNVHRNSPAPAKIGALAYAQGNDIHLGPGQEKHLPHEAWHVVQQKQNRVKATTQMKGGAAVNDDAQLEQEADVMGARANADIRQESITYRTAQSSSNVTQCYSDDTLAEQKALIRDATGNGATVLKTNEDAQQILQDSNDNGEHNLTPHFTTMGFEVEFAQQPRINEYEFAPSLLEQSHIKVAIANGYNLFPNPPFLLETDADRALEFVTPPLLAPLDEDPANEGKVVPDRTWANNARRALEFSLKDISSSEKKSVDTIIQEINNNFGVNLQPVTEGVGDVEYGEITKNTEYKNTNAQLNYMTTLQHYMEVNQATNQPGNGDPAMNVLNKFLKEVNGGQNITPEIAPYLYALSQKIREIPNIMLDETFSYILQNDDTEDDAQARANRRNLAKAASTIKDKLMLWLKASFHQILAAIPDDLYPEIANIMKLLVTKKKVAITHILTKMNTDTNNALLKYHDQKAINDFITMELDKINDILEQERPESDIAGKPAEQHTVSESRADTIGARPDTYVPADTIIGEPGQSLFLVETRKTTQYLDLQAEDKYTSNKV